MSEESPFLRNIRESAGMRLAVLFGSFFILLLFSSLLNVILNAFPLVNSRDNALLSSLFQSILAFCIPSLILAKFSSQHPLRWLKLAKTPQLKAIIGVIIVYFISMPAMEWLIEWNNNISLPESMKSLENTLREWEEANNAVSEMLLNAHGFIPVLTGLLIIGVATGFSEELFFRGGLQGIFVRSSIGKSAAVWCTAIIFSALHFQFFGFIPRLLMGVFFGYILIWNDNLWIPIFAHILNNSFVVITAAVFGVSQISTINDNIPYSGIYLPIVSLAMTVMFFILFRKFFFYSHK